MKFVRRLEKDICIVTLIGKLSRDNVNTAKTYLTPLIADESIHALILNMEKVPLVDSSGIGMLTAAFKNLQQRGAEFRMCHLGKMVQDIFEISHLDHFLKIHKTEEEAISSISVES